MAAATCHNCFAPLPEPRPSFCPHCGQETHLRPPTVGEFIQQFGGAYLSTEGALWRTLVLLLARPGELTRRYLAGRRKHYVLPLRLYLTISLLTLLLLRVATPASIGIDARESKELEAPNFVALDLGEGRGAGFKDDHFYCEGLPPWLCTRLASRLDVDRKSFRRQLQQWPERFLSHWGVAMFLLVPLFALLTQLAYRGRRLRYTEHLVYALHLHSFWFLAVVLALVPVPGAGMAVLAMPIYAVLAARRVYGGGWTGTVARALAVAVLYGLVLGIALGVVALWAFFFG